MLHGFWGFIVSGFETFGASHSLVSRSSSSWSLRFHCLCLHCGGENLLPDQLFDSRPNGGVAINLSMRLRKSAIVAGILTRRARKKQKHHVNEMMLPKTRLLRRRDGTKIQGGDSGRGLWRTGRGTKIEARAGGRDADRPQQRPERNGDGRRSRGPSTSSALTTRTWRLTPRHCGSSSARSSSPQAARTTTGTPTTALCRNSEARPC